MPEIDLSFIIGQLTFDFLVGETSASFYIFPPSGKGQPVVRIGDKNSKGAIAIQGSPNIFVNNLAWVRLGDKWSDNSTETSASTRVFLNNKGATRVGDMQSGGGLAIVGSPNVFCG